MAGRDQQAIASTVAFGVLGAAMVYFSRRAEPGLLPTIAATVGYGLVTKAVSAAVVAALSPSSD
jgi:membrane associated rhomboid family serine protease